MFHAYHILFVCSYLLVKKTQYSDSTIGKAVFLSTFKAEIPSIYVEIWNAKELLARTETIKLPTV